MAITKFGNFIVDARGSINGNVYSKNKYGSYVRTKVTPVNPQTTYQQEVRSFFANQSQAWRALTQAQRDAWNAAAPDFTRTNIFGDNVPLSGFNLYMRLNLNIIAAGGSTIDVPPAQVEVTASILSSITADNSAQTLLAGFAPTPTAAGIVHIVYATGALSPGKKFVSTQLRQIQIIAAATATGASLTAAYLAKFGTVGAVGQKIFVQFRPVDIATGIPGTTSMVSTLIVA